MYLTKRAMACAIGTAALIHGGCAPDATTHIPPTSPPLTQPVTAGQIDATIAFVRGGAIYVMAPGAAPVRLTTGASPSWSRDGKIAFVRGNTDPQIYVRDSNGERLLGAGQMPEWSPDGSRILFTRWSGQLPVGIFVMNADGSGVTQIRGDRDHEGVCSTSDAGPATWSPDGSRIAFGLLFQGFDMYDVCIMNADGSGVHSLNRSASARILSGRPAWSPDGSRIAINALQPVSGGSRFQVMSFATSGNVAEELLYQFDPGPAVATSMHWAPNGDDLIFSLNAPMSSCCYWTSRVMALSLRDDRTRQLVADPGGSAIPVDHSVAVRPSP